METELELKLLGFQKEEMISFLNSNPDAFKEAVELAVTDKQPFSWRAAWLLSGWMKPNDERIKACLDKLIRGMKGKKDGQQRELLKIIYQMDLKKKHEGRVFDVCMDIWEGIEKDPSVRVTALKMMLRIVKKYPELSQELSFLTQDHYVESLSPGIKNSVSRMIKELNTFAENV